MVGMRAGASLATLACLLTALTGGAGCRAVHTQDQLAHTSLLDGLSDNAPRELDKAILPTYRIEPPDILTIDAIHIVPKSPYRVRTLDLLAIQVRGTLPDAPIDGVYQVQAGGLVELGFSYGTAKVAGKTVEEVEDALDRHLSQHLAQPEVTVSLAETAARQQIAGEHLVGPDGTVTLGSYGSVLVVGKTIAEARQAVEEHLSQSLDDPEVSVDVFAYNSKVYYVVTQGAGLGDGVYRFPVTGNETVLDAISQINGLDQVSSKRIWIARAGPGRSCQRLLPVDWTAITQCGEADTNYQILPSDRVYIAEDKLIAFDSNLGKLIAPIERVMGFTLLGTGTATRLSGPVLRGGGNPGSNF
ncbi:MAG: polysaccharide biosynthesis/export family protein [Pirellulales bacterium]|nr:polysaccharide biosynthesis/export family protein [Pirellulales bacterium]